MPEDSRFAKYPMFQPMFDRTEGLQVPLYLTLLGADERGEVALVTLEHIISGDADLTPQVVALLDDFNWRPQLVGAVAMALGAANEESRTALWRAFDGGSWVSPQLAAVALLIDEQFEIRARQRAEACCPISRERLEGLDWAVRHGAAGPGNFIAHSGKALSALTVLCKRLPTANTWLELLLVREDIQKCLASDYDGGARIASWWLNNFTARLEGRSDMGIIAA